MSGFSVSVTFQIQTKHNAPCSTKTLQKQAFHEKRCLKEAFLVPIPSLRFLFQPNTLYVCMYVCMCMYMYMHIYIYMPKTSPGGQILGFKMSKSRGREEKLRQKKAERRKKETIWKHENPHVFVGISWPILAIKLGKMRCLTKRCSPVGVSPPPIYICICICICIYIYIYTAVTSVDSQVWVKHFKKSPVLSSKMAMKHPHLKGGGFHVSMFLLLSYLCLFLF